MDPTDPDAGGRGILARVPHLQVWLHVAFVAAIVASVGRYLGAHGLGDRAGVVLGGAAAMLAVYGADPRRWRHPPGAARSAAVTVWCATLVAVWAALAMVAPSFSWVAAPLAFVALQVLPFGAAAALVAAMTLTVAAAWTSMQHRFDPTVIVGPCSVAALAVIAYRALEREAATRRRLLDDLSDAQRDLAAAQHAAGALAERARLSREIHDSVAQSLSSINLLLQAAERDWQAHPPAAREHVRHAAVAAREGLVDVRRVVRDLAAPAVDDTGEGGTALADALGRTCRQATATSALRVDVHVHGQPVAVPDAVASALLRSARGALANVVEHAEASRVAVSLTYQPDEVILDVRDDGRGFDPDGVRPDGDRGRGLAGIAARARDHGGSLVVESAPGAGTALALSIPVGAAP